MMNLADKLLNLKISTLTYSKTVKILFKSPTKYFDISSLIGARHAKPTKR